MAPGLNERQPARGTTPFAYATPHSNAPLQEARPRDVQNVVLYPSDGDDDDLDGDYNVDMEMYENTSADDAFEDDGEDTRSIATNEMPISDAQPGLSSTLLDSQHRHRQQQLPEDEPWPGIEDPHQHQRRHSDGENVDPQCADELDHHSDASSQPSEYPSTQRVWPAAGNGQGVAFQIHEDEDAYIDESS
jgi:hypothetical protein